MRQHILFLTVLTGIVLFVTGCQKSFLEQPPQDRITIDKFYQDAEQINAATATLYGLPWFVFNNTAIYAIGDLAAGNLFTGNGECKPYMNFSLQPNNTPLNEAWISLYKVIGMSNMVIKNVPVKAPASVDKVVMNNAVGEARFMRALAYFYLVRIWGAVPIVTDPEALAMGDIRIPRNPVEDIYKFILQDLEFAEANCAKERSVTGRVSSWTVKALMSKVYLYQKNYPLALQKAEDVINSGQYSLMPEYAQLFRTKNNNNPESIFALQWVACPACWGQQNTMQAYFAPYGQGVVETGDGWGSFEPSIDLQSAYEAGDKRKKPTIMTPGDSYPELISKVNPTGYTYPSNRNLTATKASLRKYVVGSPVGPDGPVYFMSTGINTNIIRYAEVLLIAAEAIMAGNNSTTDPKALGYVNAVRKRAGLPDKQSLTFDELLHERRIELAIESDYWYDLGRIDRAKAIQIISNQERGFYSGKDIISQKFTPLEKDFLLPLPQQETDRNPRLREEPVPFQF